MTTPISASVSLKHGDRLTREEFHRWYCLRPDIKKAELIDGVVYVPSPVSLRHHGRPHGFIVGWLSHYMLSAPAVIMGDNTTVYLDGQVEVQPDAFLWLPEHSNARENEEGYLMEELPELVVEVAASSVSYDLHEKKEAYRRNGVPEYVVWRVLDEAIDWFRLQDGIYILIEPDAEGTIESEQFPGLRLHVPSMLAGDFASVLARVRPSPDA